MNGIINVYKEPGYTSHDVVAKLRGILKQKKIGHTGTLDPDAAGVLPVCLGNATKVCDLLTDETKEYVALLHLGIVTDTYDLSGKMLSEEPEKAAAVTKEELQKALLSFTGTIEQIPPMYSAIKVDGKKLYELARKGIEVERKPRTVTIERLELLSGENTTFRLRIVCSKGTYIRSLCHDIGQVLGCGGAMEELLRTRVGRFTIEDAVKLSVIEDAAHKISISPETDITELGLHKSIIQADGIFEDRPAFFVTPAGDRALKNGNQLSSDMLDLKRSGTEAPSKEREYRIYDPEGRFCGLYLYKKEWGVLTPVKMFLS
ncbi:MAG: tRNA pseudouridine(55) synthase TruB [Lachnospiraceae bacterium]|nr:tRNA pseudouridine(55) synthase TruB [Lachnospiraceae bacterium]